MRSSAVRRVGFSAVAAVHKMCWLWLTLDLKGRTNTIHGGEQNCLLIKKQFLEDKQAYSLYTICTLKEDCVNNGGYEKNC